MASGTSYGVRKPRNTSPTAVPTGPVVCPKKAKLVDEIIKKLERQDAKKK